MADDLDRILKAEETQLTRDKEIDRILAGNEYDYFGLLMINPLGMENEEMLKLVKNIYRRKALLIHPDKTTNPLAPTAFNRLKKAEQVLSTTEESENKVLFQEKERLVAIYNDVNQENEIIADWTDGTNRQIRAKVEKILQQEMKQQEIEKMYQQRQDQQRDEEVKSALTQRGIKKKLEAKWEDDRDERVQSWRNYSSKVEKKKDKSKTKLKKKKKVLA